jgi:hypothetical protein
MKQTNVHVIARIVRSSLSRMAACVSLVLVVAVVGAQAAGPQQGGNAEVKWEDLTPEQRMQRRFPQPVRVGDLIGLPVLDENDSTIGRIRHVVRTSGGKVQLIVPYGGVFGWGSRLVAVPIEVVGILGRQVATLEFDRPAFDAAPTWGVGSDQQLSPDDSILIALHRR